MAARTTFCNHFAYLGDRASGSRGPASAATNLLVVQTEIGLPRRQPDAPCPVSSRSPTPLRSAGRRC